VRDKDAFTGLVKLTGVSMGTSIFQYDKNMPIMGGFMDKRMINNIQMDWVMEL
jgi:hypothetical protein